MEKASSVMLKTFRGSWGFNMADSLPEWRMHTFVVKLYASTESGHHSNGPIWTVSVRNFIQLPLRYEALRFTFFSFRAPSINRFYARWMCVTCQMPDASSWIIRRLNFIDGTDTRYRLRLIKEGSVVRPGEVHDLSNVNSLLTFIKLRRFFIYCLLVKVITRLAGSRCSLSLSFFSIWNFRWL